ncbi:MULTISPECIES: TraR/DksA C4-type zinc finger protein [Enterobacter]|uniref:TraR/DksA C4-type zinc finger protein n=1 Tax=Enterobacter TaxID=547 RepID=UPI0007AE0469|nr:MULTISPECIES: TraR/DksA C4-type zinc finger protein [Enterobacter]AMZ77776.1 hypothetical protein A4308_12520 [Enterobacter sp. ODB01]EKS6337607.1 TraR/DksA C4-type zinc finger protein [Enterobacter hormaechei]VAL43369.1 phage/conjugal plasmid C-4 type zinc finger protein, TraR family [Enterobacter kobei]
MADEADRALILTEMLIQAGLHRVRVSQSARGTVQCADCGEDIPASRRDCYPAATTCVDCQLRREEHERRRVR